MPASPVEDLFFAALGKPTAEERAAFLDAACAGDAGLRRRVERLLAAHPKAAEFLEEPAAGTPTRDFPDDGRPQAVAAAEEPGQWVGPYKLLQKLGEGGMGEVWVAEQEQPVKRRVALKLIKPGMDSDRVIARFEAERQALALMDHTNIAKVFDAGTTPAGRPYFAMELVKGVPITTVLRRAAPERPRAARAVRPGLPGGAARPPEGRHPPGHQADQRPGRHPGRQAGAEGDRLRRRQGGPRQARRADAVHRTRGGDRHARIHGPGAGGAVGRSTWTRGRTCTPSGRCCTNC